MMNGILFCAWGVILLLANSCTNAKNGSSQLSDPVAICLEERMAKSGAKYQEIIEWRRAVDSLDAMGSIDGVKARKVWIKHVLIRSGLLVDGAFQYGVFKECLETAKHFKDTNSTYYQYWLVMDQLDQVDMDINLNAIGNTFSIVFDSTSFAENPELRLAYIIGNAGIIFSMENTTRKLLSRAMNTQAPTGRHNAGGPQIIPPANSKPTVSNPDTEPSFPGGKEVMNTFVQREFKRTKVMGINEIIAFINCTITAKGVIEEAHIMKGGTSLVNTEIYRVLNAMPFWIPATKDGEPVKATLLVKVMIPAS